MKSPLWDLVREALRDREVKAIDRIEQELSQATGSLPEPIFNALAAQIALLRGDERGARRCLIGASKKRPLDPHEKLILGFVLIQDPSKAEKLFRAAADAQISDPRVSEGLGLVAIREGRMDDGILHLSKSVQEDPRNWSACYALAMALMHQGRYAQAGARFEETVKLQPDFEPAWLGLAAAGIQTGRAAEVSEAMRRIVQAAPQREKLTLAYVDCLRHAGDFESAAKALTPIADRTQDVDMLFDYVGLCLRGSLSESATKALKKIEQIDPKQPRLQIYRNKLKELTECT